MPIYEFKCRKCDNEFEELVQKHDEVVDCPDCQSGEIYRKVSLTSFALKGNGWYKDHYGIKKPVSTPKESNA